MRSIQRLLWLEIPGKICDQFVTTKNVNIENKQCWHCWKWQSISLAIYFETKSLGKSKQRLRHLACSYQSKKNCWFPTPDLTKKDGQINGWLNLFDVKTHILKLNHWQKIKQWLQQSHPYKSKFVFWKKIKGKQAIIQPSLQLYGMIYLAKTIPLCRGMVWLLWQKVIISNKP